MREKDEHDLTCEYPFLKAKSSMLVCHDVSDIPSQPLFFLKTVSFGWRSQVTNSRDM